mmetsp:Transcript_50516/g.120192  ORF Transcript_50516/g.120192 Transcript_50516/m.120192 type:complete len:200 (+) Transcript_50516:213-812(+)
MRDSDQRCRKVPRVQLRPTLVERTFRAVVRFWIQLSDVAAEEAGSIFEGDLASLLGLALAPPLKVRDSRGTSRGARERRPLRLGSGVDDRTPSVARSAPPPSAQGSHRRDRRRASRWHHRGAWRGHPHGPLEERVQQPVSNTQRRYLLLEEVGEGKGMFEDAVALDVSLRHSRRPLVGLHGREKRQLRVSNDRCVCRER